MDPYMHAPLPMSQELTLSKLSDGSKIREIPMLGRETFYVTPKPNRYATLEELTNYCLSGAQVTYIGDLRARHQEIIPANGSAFGLEGEMMSAW